MSIFKFFILDGIVSAESDLRKSHLVNPELFVSHCFTLIFSSF